MLVLFFCSAQFFWFSCLSFKGIRGKWGSGKSDECVVERRESSTVDEASFNNQFSPDSLVVTIRSGRIGAICRGKRFDLKIIRYFPTLAFLVLTGFCSCFFQNGGQFFRKRWIETWCTLSLKQ